MARYALIRDADGRVLNVVEYDGTATYTPPSGCSVRVATAAAEVGGTWNGTIFLPAPPPAGPDPQIAADKTQVDAFMNAGSGTATPTQRDDTIKAIIRYLRRRGDDA